MQGEKDVRVIKVFVSSPADVAPERGRVQAVAAKLNREFDGIVRLEPVLWEEHLYQATRSFQPQIPEAAACDMLVSIFWTRVGTELPADFARMPDGKPYPSGTVYELLTALDASKAKGVPDVYVFRKTADAVLPTTDADRFRQARAQFESLEAFWNEWFRSEQGHFKAAFQTFANTDEFERQIEKLLRQWLADHGELGPRLTWPAEKGPPFRGLAPFEAQHAAVFFGRDRAIEQACQRLIAAANDTIPFLLVVGASGSGKSSLARAGVIPRLTTPGVVASVDVWRTAIMKPSEGQSGPLASLATALLTALPELAQGDFPTVGALTDNLRRGGPSAARPVVGALARVAEAMQRKHASETRPRAALALLVDQVEELFAQATSDDERTGFAQALKELVATGAVWCIGTLRADLYEPWLRQPLLNALKEEGASIDLAPPGPAELAEIVRAPAAAAGLVFEHHPQYGPLDDRLLADAKTADSLPLLQFTLRQLYDRREQRNGETLLTHAAYEALGKLQGAIAAEAERAVADLPAGVFAVLPRLLRQLAEPARDNRTLTLRDVAQADVSTDPAEAALVDALLRARILIAHHDANKRAVLRLAHDAVLTSWPRAAVAAQASREFYRVRADVEEAFERWKENGKVKDRLIPSGIPLAEADKLVADFGRELPAELVAFVRASRDRARVRQRLVAAAAIFFLCLAIAATVSSIWAYRAQQQAVAARQQAVESQQRALVERDRALLHDSRRLLDVISQTNDHNSSERALLALEGLSGVGPDEQRPHIPELEAHLYRSVARNREILLADSFKKSPDSRSAAIINDDGSVSLYDLEAGRTAAVLKGHAEKVNRVSFSKDGKLVATASDDKTARIWNAETGAAVTVLSGHTGPVTFVAFEEGDDDRSAVTLSEDGSLRRWSVPNGRLLVAFAGHEGAVRRYSSNYRARLLATASDKHVVRLWNIDTGQELARPDSEDMAGVEARAIHATILTMDREGRWLVISRFGTKDEAVLWDRAQGRVTARFDSIGLFAYFADNDRLIFLFPKNILDDNALTRLVDAQTGKIVWERRGLGVVQVEGDRFLTEDSSGERKTIRLWDRTTLQPKAELSGHEGNVRFHGFIGSGEQIVTVGGDGTARIWKSETGELARVITIPQLTSFSDVRPSADNRRVVLIPQQGNAEIWDLVAGTKVADLDTRENSYEEDGKRLGLTDVVVSRDDKQLAARLKDTRKVRVWDFESGSVVATIPVPDGATSLDFSPDGSRLLAQGDGVATVVDVAGERTLATVDAPGRGAFSGGGNAIIAEQDGSTGLGKARPTRVWRAAPAAGVLADRALTGTTRFGSIPVASPPAMLALTTPDDADLLGLPAPDGPSDDKASVLLDVGARKVLHRFASDPLQQVLLASPDGRRLLVTDENGEALIWDVLADKAVGPKLEGDFGLLTFSSRHAFNRDGRRLCTAALDKGELKLIVWNLDDGKRVESVTRVGPDDDSSFGEISLGFSADGLRITVAVGLENESRALVFDAPTATLKREIKSEGKEKIVLSRSGKRVLFLPDRMTDEDEPRGRLVDADTGASAVLVLGRSSYSAWFSAGEDKLAISSYGTLGVWDAASGALLKTIRPPENAWVRVAAFDPDATSIAVAASQGLMSRSADVPVIIYDLRSDASRQIASGMKEVELMAFSDDRTWLALQGDEIRVFRLAGSDATVASRTTTPPGHISFPDRMMFTPDKRFLLVGRSQDLQSGTFIQRLLPKTEDLVAFARSAVPRCLTPVERDQYFLDPEPPLWCVEMGKWPYNTSDWANWLKERKAGRQPGLPVDERFPPAQQ